VTPRELAELRVRLAGHLRARGDVRTERVAAAFERVPRHLFVPDVPIEEAYADRSIAIKLADGVPISSSSQPAIMAEMLEMLAVREGDRVLEIGAGSGYNAALLSELAGRSGFVETLDIEDDLVAAARRRLDEAGYHRVRTLRADGANGDPDGAQFDAVIASVGVERIPPAWIAQLRTGGRLVAPLTIRSLQKVVAFQRTERGLESVAIVDAGFMMLRGPFATADSVVITLGEPGITLHVLTEHASAVNADAIARALRETSHDTQPARRVRLEDVWNGFSVWLALHDDALCRLTAHGASAQLGIVPGLVPGGESLYGYAATFGICTSNELVVFAPRSGQDVVLRHFGENGGGLARLQSAIEAWDDAGRPGNAQLRISVDVAGTSRARVSARTKP
jgi:protein-L-isoaspartate(D-aspartate) O-methyltransferase